MKKNISLILPILVNIYPIFGVIFFDWNVYFTLFIYFVETLILIIFSTVKMIMSPNIWDPEMARINSFWVKQKRSYVLINQLLMMYVWMFVCSSLFLILFNKTIIIYTTTARFNQYIPILSMIIFSFISHTFSFLSNFIFGDERKTGTMSHIFNRIMLGRIFPLFFSTFIFFIYSFFIGIMRINSENALLPLVVIFCFIAFFDIIAYRKEHKIIS